MAGYLTALSSPSLVLRTTIRRCSPRSKPAVHTRLPTFSIASRSIVRRSSSWPAMAIMLASRWQAPSVLICTTGTPICSMRSASIEPAMSPSITAGLQPALQMREQCLQQRGLARAGRAHHVDAEDAGGIEPGAILGGELVVGFEDFLGGDDFHGSLYSSCARLTRADILFFDFDALQHEFPAAFDGDVAAGALGHWTTRSSISVRALQAWQLQTAFGSWITISAFSTGVPGAAARRRSGPTRS